MKKILICVGCLALMLTAHGQQRNDTTSVKTKKARATAMTSAKTGAAVNSSTQVRVHRDMANARVRQHSNVSAQTNAATARVNRNRTRNMSANSRVRSRSDVAINHERNMTASRNRSAMVTSNRNATVNRNRNVTVNRNRNLMVSGNQNVRINRNQTRQPKRNDQSEPDRVSFNEAVSLHRHEFHSRDWWRNHFDTIVFVNGGWWLWDAGWWFPAYGYAPGSYYPYDGPIYGYRDLTPDRVVVDVQTQLRRDGYYAGPIDGVLGPRTRRAITAFQADHGLAITPTIDEPTLDTLGLS